MTYKASRIKTGIETALVWPLVQIGKVIGFFYPCPSEANVFLIFPNDDVGGSYKVNADIALLTKTMKPIMIFTKFPKNRGYKKLFEQTGVPSLFIEKQIDRKVFHFLNIIWRGIIVSWINKRPNPVVFGGECIFFYKLLPFVKMGTRTIELCHVNRWLNYTQAFAPIIDHRVFSTRKILRDHQQQYEKQKIPAPFFERLHFIDNKIDMPEEVHPVAGNSFRVLFVGRGGPQKRVHLVAAIAQQAMKMQPDIEFTLVGDVEDFISPENKKGLIIRTDVRNQTQLNELYKNHQVLLLTSLFEGLPIVVMDMMANARVVVSTSVDGIPDYIEDKKNGLLISEIENEEAIVSKGVDLILQLYHHPERVNELSANARQVALSCFSATIFDKAYLELFASQVAD